MFNPIKKSKLRFWYFSEKVSREGILLCLAQPLIELQIQGLVISSGGSGDSKGLPSLRRPGASYCSSSTSTAYSSEPSVFCLSTHFPTIELEVDK